MSITSVKVQLVEHCNTMFNNRYLFITDIDKDALYEQYLKAFAPENNAIYRVRQEHDCSACRNFIKSLGSVVAINNGILTSVWDFDCGDEVYAPAFAAMAAYIKSRPVIGIYMSRERVAGINKNHEMLDNGEVIEYEHFYSPIATPFVNSSSATRNAAYVSAREAFKNSLEKISIDSINVVLELIDANSLYKGAEWKAPLTEFKTYKLSYDKIGEPEIRELFTWEFSGAAGPVISRMKNHSIGTLLMDISGGMELDLAVKRYEKIVAPENYKRPKPIFTARMLEDAKKTIEELGYMDSLPRRYARLDDISVENVLFANRDVSARLRSKHGIFDEMKATVGSLDAKKFSRTESVPIETFINDILPTANSVEVLLENKHAANLVSLITAENSDAPSMFKWNNPFSWAYTGNIADSSIRDNVKAAGGSVTGILRFSIQWNDEPGKHDGNDIDAHCHEPNGYKIYYGNARLISPTGGVLDVDIRVPTRGQAAVENITWANKHVMKSGTYQFYVHCFANRGGTSGFSAELEANGVIHSFNYGAPMRQNEMIHVADVVYNGDSFTVIEKLPSTVSSRELWGINTGNFVPVSVILKSPNSWTASGAIGNEHLFFMLQGCVSSQTPNGFYNEFLKQELAVHRQVLEALGSKMQVTVVPDQLSGLGFSSTKRAEIVVKIKGATERIMKVVI